ncbi:MAG: DUF2163 domain-containing protein [Negativicutes bacterium]
MIAWLGKEVTTSAYCFRLTLADSTVIGFTSHDQDLVISGVTYEAATGFTPMAASSSRDMAVDNMDVDGIIDSDRITKSDILTGRYKGAKILIFECNWSNLSDTIHIIRVGTIGEIKTGRQMFTAEIRGLLQAFQQENGEEYQKTCRATLGDVKCGKVLTAYKFNGTITAVNLDGTYNTNLTNADNYFSYGLIEFTSGANDNLSYEVKQSLLASGKITPFLPIPFAVAVGDTFTATAGCDGNFSTCVAKFSNAVNFRGEPHVPGSDYATCYPRQETNNTVSEGQSAKR